ncbi:MAG TPA: hypothetical protein VKG25_16770 [Bryobacteraceae bacterium]|nr:hypothetical protein [Bryobacteraceae bacterium]
MRRLLTLALLAPLFLPADETLPKAESILDRSVELTGGKAAYDQIHNVIEKGTFDLPKQGVHGTAAIYAAEPNKLYESIEIEGIGKIESGVSGDVAWENSVLQGPHLKTGDEKAETLQGATFNAPANWRKMFTKVETTGTETVGAHDCYIVVLTSAVGKPITQDYDKKSGLLIKSVATRTTAMGDITVEILYDDYRKDGTILSPHKLINKVASQEFVININSAEYNTQLPANAFDIPADIQALMKPAAAPKAPETPVSAAAGAGSTVGKLTLYQGGKPMASESYTLDRANGKISIAGSGDANIGGVMKVTIERFDVIMTDKFRPVSAEAKAKMGTIPISVSTLFDGGKAVSQINNGSTTKTKEDDVHPDPIVVQANLPLYPWSILAARASFDTKEPQQFPIYVLGSAEVMAQVLYKGKEPVEFAGGKTADLHHLSVNVTPPQGSPTTLDFWLDDSRKIIKILVSSLSVEGYQEGYDRKAPDVPPAPHGR